MAYKYFKGPFASEGSMSITGDVSFLGDVVLKEGTVGNEELAGSITIDKMAAVAQDLSGMVSHNQFVTALAVKSFVTTIAENLASDLDAEEAARIAADDAETAARIAADDALTAALNAGLTEAGNGRAADKTALEAAIAALQADVDQNEADSDAAEAALGESLSNEVTRALAAESGLQGAIDQERADREAGDNGLNNRADSADARLNTLEGGVEVVGSLAKVAHDLQNAINDERSQREAGDNGLNNRADSADARLDTLQGGVEVVGSLAKAAHDLQNAINQEASDRSTADGQLHGRVDAADAAIIAETTRATGAEQGLSQAIAGEEARAIAAEAALGARIDDVISNTDSAALDSLTEVVDAFQAMDGNLSDAIAALGTSHTSDLAAETAARIAAIDALQADVDQNEADADAAMTAEISARSTADAALQAEMDIVRSQDVNQAGSMAKMASDIYAAIAGVQADVDQNEADADAAMTAEATERATADAALQAEMDIVRSPDVNQAGSMAKMASELHAAIDQERADRESGDTGLNNRADSADARLDTLEGGVEVVGSLAKVAHDLQNAINQEASDRSAADGQLHARVDSADAAIAAEKTRAETTEAGLQAEVDIIRSPDVNQAGSMAKMASELHAAIDQERADRESGDTGLNNRADSADARLNTLEGGVEVVGSLAKVAHDLQNAINDERSQREAGDNGLQGEMDIVRGPDTQEGSIAKAKKDAFDAIGAEQSRAEGAEQGLQTAIDTESSHRQQGDLNATNDRSAIRNELATAVSTLKGDAGASYDTLGKLEDKIQAEEARVDAILEAADADKDSFAEIVTLINSVDMSADDALGTAVGNINDAIAAVQADVDQNEADADAAIAGEAAARSAALTALKGDAGASYDTLGKLEDKIQEEASARAAADTALTNSIADEANDRVAADNQLAAAIASLGVDAGNNLQNAIDASDAASAAALAAETAARIAADSAATSDRSAMRTEFGDADAALKSSLEADMALEHSKMHSVQSFMNAGGVVTDGKRFVMASASAGDITINLPGTDGYGDGYMLSIKRTDGITANVVKLQPAGNAAVDGSNDQLIVHAHASVDLLCFNGEWFLV